MKINLIPFNPHPSRDFKRPPEAQIKKFENVLRRYKVPFTTRIEKGGDIHAACGQLMAEYKKTE
jgi:23S rRNA (adenine2503-C2)-methyltransferase